LRHLLRVEKHAFRGIVKRLGRSIDGLTNAADSFLRSAACLMPDCRRRHIWRRNLIHGSAPGLLNLLRPLRVEISHTPL
jgi:hypothetical protein